MFQFGKNASAECFWRCSDHRPLLYASAQPLPVSTVFVVENEMTFLSFPPVPDAVAIWGKGNAAWEIMPLAWLASRSVYYLGDIDAWGFKILGDLRSAFPNVVSLLLDRATLD